MFGISKKRAVYNHSTDAISRTCVQSPSSNYIALQLNSANYFLLLSPHIVTEKFTYLIIDVALSRVEN